MYVFNDQGEIYALSRINGNTLKIFFHFSVSPLIRTIGAGTFDFLYFEKSIILKQNLMTSAKYDKELARYNNRDPQTSLYGESAAANYDVHSCSEDDDLDSTNNPCGLEESSDSVSRTNGQVPQKPKGSKSKPRKFVAKKLTTSSSQVPSHSEPEPTSHTSKDEGIAVFIPARSSYDSIFFVLRRASINN